jgi:hypothetical protein
LPLSLTTVTLSHNSWSPSSPPVESPPPAAHVTNELPFSLADCFRLDHHLPRAPRRPPSPSCAMVTSSLAVSSSSRSMARAGPRAHGVHGAPKVGPVQGASLWCSSSSGDGIATTIIQWCGFESGPVGLDPSPCFFIF